MNLLVNWYHTEMTYWSASELGAMTLRLIFATVLGGLIGWERERHDRPAGLRTHMLVCIGSALITIISMHFDRAAGSDPSRVMSNIVTGIGFLGAGTIIRQGSIVRGLTTAASLWVVSAVGMAAGIGREFYVMALIATLIIYLTLTVVNQFEDRLMAKRHYRDLILTSGANPELLGAVMDLLDPLQVTVKSVTREPGNDVGVRVIRLGLRMPPGLRIDKVTRELARLTEISRIEWE